MVLDSGRESILVKLRRRSDRDRCMREGYTMLD